MKFAFNDYFEMFTTEMDDNGYNWDDLAYNLTDFTNTTNNTDERMVNYLDNASQQEDNDTIFFLVFLSGVLMLTLIYIKCYLWPTRVTLPTVIILTPENIQRRNLPLPKEDAPPQIDPPPQYDHPPSYNEVTINVPEDIQLVQK